MSVFEPQQKLMDTKAILAFHTEAKQTHTLSMRVIVYKNSPKKTHCTFLFSTLPNLRRWKLHDLSVTQILREINFGETRSCKITFYAIFVNFVNFSLPRFLKKKIKIHWLKWQILISTLDSPTLISRKIWDTEKLLVTLILKWFLFAMGKFQKSLPP